MRNRTCGHWRGCSTGNERRNMDTLIAEVAKALAWPVSALVMAWMARKPLISLVEGIRLTVLKRGEWELHFAERKREIQRNLPAESLSARRPAGRLVEELKSELESAPAEAVMTAWSRVEARVHALAGANGVADQGIDAALSELVEKGLIEHATPGLGQRPSSTSEPGRPFARRATRVQGPRIRCNGGRHHLGSRRRSGGKNAAAQPGWSADPGGRD